MFDLHQFEYILRVLLAGICGIIVGMERKNRSKEAGVRTHFVVASGAALMMILSKYSFYDLMPDLSGVRGADPARIAAQVVSGIGFLGAGMIFVHKNTITGLTTAAGIWATSGIGMAIGAGMYLLGISFTLIILTAQIVLHLNIHKNKTTKAKILTVIDVTEDGYQRYLTNVFEEMNIYINDVSVDYSGETNAKNYTFIIDMPLSVNEDEIVTKAKYKSKIKSC